jgi:dipeptidyl aminopeptidase/acylaminoacyl peptidase
MKHNVQIFIAAVLLFCLASCSKKDDGPAGTGNTKNLPGIIYYDWATEGLLKMNLATGTKSTVLPDDNKRYAWDISRDGKTMLISAEPEDQDYDANLYTYINIPDGSIIKQFKYYPKEGDITIPYLSFDQQYIAVGPTFDDGIVIMDINGNVLHNLVSYQDKKIASHICWMPDNTLLFRVENNLYRTDAGFTRATLVRNMNFADWGGFEPSADGSKIAFHAGNHLWLMNADGSNMVQVTDSDAQEAYPYFSPDGKYLLFGADFHSTGPFGHLWYLTVIPADGQLYNVNEGADKRVIPLTAKGESMPQAASGGMAWR